METSAILLPVILLLCIPLLPPGLRFAYTLVFTLGVAGLTSAVAINLFVSSGATEWVYEAAHPWGSCLFVLDKPGAFFLLVTNFTVLTGLIYGSGYLAPYRKIKTESQISLHYVAYAALHLSMLGVILVREGTAFLIAWELMAMSSFILILFDAEDHRTLKTAVNYLVQMHVSFLFLATGFLIAGNEGPFGFDGLTGYFATHNNLPVFLLLFAGFAMKAGFVPFHTWLPEAHPAAPSHVSGVMSGVMIKMGIYGIFRVLATLQQDLLTIAMILLVVSMITMVYGIIQSVIQTDLKRMLAYSTIENVGIIGVGIGTGMTGMASDNDLLAYLGFGGALFHVMNHSLFKSLLFYGAGSVYTATHTRNMNLLGGLIHKMPKTATLFLIGSVAICALPPLNGLMSELVIYYGLFTGLMSGNVYHSVVFVMAVIALALTGGMALYGFTRAFGLTFLGNPRPGIHVNPDAITPMMMASKMASALMIILTGLAPLVVLIPVLQVTGSWFGLTPVHFPSGMLTALEHVSLTGVILVMVLILLGFIRSRMVKPSVTSYGPTWGCGYTAGSSRHQYTGSSWSANFSELAKPVLPEKTETLPIGEEELFPSNRTFNHGISEGIRHAINRLAGAATSGLKWLARLQTGNIRHYILYAFLFLLIIFILLILNLI
jgi:formate hydrogenlyase subunit 3/multisubunit Na+/H+ antiporter MnhD subunit